MTSVATMRMPVIATANVEPAGASVPDAAFANDPEHRDGIVHRTKAEAAEHAH
jgi:hypothetical protein